MIALDASALLAFLFREPGHERVAAHLHDALLSTVNLAEVLGRFARDGHDPGEVLAVIRRSSVRVVPFGEQDAVMAAALEPLTRRAGLSLGDRACLALAASRDVPALTTDETWASLDLPVAVELVRPPSRRRKR